MFENLAVLCMDCHTDTQLRGGFHRKLEADVVVLYREDWVASVARKREPESPPLDGSSVCFKHFRFRSRLAAKWAVLFDCLRIPYEYEPDYGFHVDRYVPNFFLPRMGFEPEQDRYKGIFLSLTAAYPSNDEIDKANRLKDASGREVFLFYGSTFEHGLFCWGSRGKAVGGKSVSPAWLEQCPFCGEVEFSFKPEEAGDRLLSVHHYCLEACKLAKVYDVMDWFLDCQDHSTVTARVYHSCHSPMLDLAYEVAESGRFEHADYAAEVRAVARGIGRLKEQRIFSTHEVMAAIRSIAEALRPDPNCPRYEQHEPWYVPHLAHLRSGSRAACPCSSCEHRRAEHPHPS